MGANEHRAAQRIESVNARPDRLLVLPPRVDATSNDGDRRIVEYLREQRDAQQRLRMEGAAISGAIRRRHVSRRGCLA